MKRSFALFTLVLVFSVAMLPVVAFAAEMATGVEFNPNNLIIGGVAVAPLISIIVFIIKGWTNRDRKYIPLINVIPGTIAVLVVGVVNEGMPLLNAVIMTLGVVLGPQVFL